MLFIAQCCSIKLLLPCMLHIAQFVLLISVCRSLFIVRCSGPVRILLIVCCSCATYMLSYVAHCALLMSCILLIVCHTLLIVCCYCMLLLCCTLPYVAHYVLLNVAHCSLCFAQCCSMLIVCCSLLLMADCELQNLEEIDTVELLD